MIKKLCLKNKTKQEARVTNWVFKCQKGLLEEHTKSFMCIKMLCNLKKDWVSWRPSKLDSSIFIHLRRCIPSIFM